MKITPKPFLILPNLLEGSILNQKLESKSMQTTVYKIENTYKDYVDYRTMLPPATKAEKRFEGKEEEVRTGAKIMRNDPCSCGSGMKYKKCCLGHTEPRKTTQYQINEENGLLNVSKTETSLKGVYKESCNRTACQKPKSAYYYNHSTEKYYCSNCAHLINMANPDLYKEYGHDLCTYVKPE